MFSPIRIRAMRSALLGLPVAAMLASPIVLTACTATQVTKADAVVSKVQTDIKLIAANVNAVVAGLAAVPAVPAADLAKIQAANATVQAEAARLLALPAPTAAEFATLAQAVPSIEAIVLPLGAIPAVAPFVPLIKIAMATLPLIVAEVEAAKS
jgi:hypothetical protein